MTPRRKPAAPQSAHISGDSATTVPGMLINRDPPKGSGWCGTENCKHESHKFYNQPAVAV